MMTLRTTALDIGYGQKRIAEKLELNLAAGKLVCLLGQNGVGKSTLLRTLSHLQEPLAGKIFLGDHEIDLLDRRDVYKRQESILALNPDIVLAFSSGAENRQLEKLKELGVKVVMNAGYMETSVLGRYEWIKFLGHLTGTEQKANEIFNQKVLIYDSLMQLVRGKEQPTVITGSLYGGTWYMPAGKNYGANIITAAGGNYLWAKDQGTGWLSMDFESVFEHGYGAEYWIGVASYQALDQLRTFDERYADFDAFKNGKVYSYKMCIRDSSRMIHAAFHFTFLPKAQIKLITGRSPGSSILLICLPILPMAIGISTVAFEDQKWKHHIRLLPRITVAGTASGFALVQHRIPF